MAASLLPTSVEVVTVEREHCFRHESEIKKQKKGKAPARLSDKSDLAIFFYPSI